MTKITYKRTNILKHQGLVFDMDGTLLNTLEGHSKAFNRALKKLKMPQHSIDSYRYFIGNGAQDCAEKSLPPDSKHLVEACVTLFKEDYANSWQETTVPYLGIVKLLKKVSHLNIKISVLSNKDDKFTQEMIRKSFPSVNFDYIAGFGHEKSVKHKPHPSGPNLIASKLGCEVEQLVMIGDTPTDMKTAITSHMTPIGVSWGFRTQKELYQAGASEVLSAPEQLLDFLNA